MNKFEAQLTAINNCFLAKQIKDVSIDKIEVIDITYDYDVDKWIVDYTVTYCDKSEDEFTFVVDDNRNKYKVDSIIDEISVTLI